MIVPCVNDFDMHLAFLQVICVVGHGGSCCSWCRGDGWPVEWDQACGIPAGDGAGLFWDQRTVFTAAILAC